MNTTETSVVALEAASNMSAVQQAAHRLLSGAEETAAGQVDLTHALLPILDRPLFYRFADKSLSFTPADYLTTPQKKNNKGETVNDMAHHNIRWQTLCDSFGLDVDRAEVIKSKVVRCIRSALGMQVLIEGADAKFGTSEAGHLIVPAAVAFDLMNEKGEATAHGKAAFNVAKTKADAKAEAIAEIKGEPVVPPTDEEVWTIAANLPVECSGAKHKPGKADTTGGFGELPTNTTALGRLEQIAIDSGYAPQPRGRASRAAEGEDTTPLGKAITLLTKALTPGDDGLLAVALKDGQVEALGKLLPLIEDLLDAEEEAKAAEAAAAAEA